MKIKPTYIRLLNNVCAKVSLLCVFSFLICFPNYEIPDVGNFNMQLNGMWYNMPYIPIWHIISHDIQIKWDTWYAEDQAGDITTETELRQLNTHITHIPRSVVCNNIPNYPR